ncbi:OmpA family protein [Flavobacterium sp. HSC-61S13]|uniref:OmpA family protein n=1 Tax=Flavobacterium sp. HSC-61S13 TaxID=2910963 RepID=UPI00209F79B9|nr:OmpA family protein [Flavobacterium sp. HSC-61S13]MCP1995161.1 outer membrane protein OmpA-like peptidoglycan-associated protein [Flavobacterium sp. HSC-61S13]
MRYYSCVCLFIAYLLSFSATAQEENIHSVYFDFDQYQIKNKEQQLLLAFIKDLDTVAIETIEIFGYCDDRGKDDYNFKLSEKRAYAIQKVILDQGIRNKVVVTIEGKGRVMIDQDFSKDLTKLRQKNRRVDLLLNFKQIPFEKQPGIYTEFKDSLVEGDRIILQNVYFEQGHSKLTPKAKKELREIAKKMKAQKDFNFEIHGHICCTPKRYKETFDKSTHKRELSSNRAKNVYLFLIQLKVPKDRLKHFGCGNEYPLNLTPDLDRRVEVLITK